MIPVALFARPPIAGRCKTRLGAAIGAERAAALYRAFVIDTIATCRAVPELAPELHVTEALDHPFFAELGARFDLPPPRLQSPGDLGARMQRALDRLPDEHSIVIGTDAPALDRAILRCAADALASRDVVLSPAADGGYVLIASAGRAPTTFLCDPSIRWSSAHALADTMRAAHDAGRSVALTAPSYDVDTLDDLALLALHLRLDPARAPTTAAALCRWSPF